MVVGTVFVVLGVGVAFVPVGSVAAGDGADVGAPHVVHVAAHIRVKNARPNPAVSHCFTSLPGQPGEPVGQVISGRHMDAICEQFVTLVILNTSAYA